MKDYSRELKTQPMVSSVLEEDWVGEGKKGNCYPQPGVIVLFLLILGKRDLTIYTIKP